MRKAMPDKDGNLLYYESTGEGQGVVTLKLKSERFERRIGFYSGNTLQVQRDRAKHEFQKGAEWGFNYQLVKEGKFKYIVVADKGDDISYYIDREDALSYGHVRHFKKQGFELQIFVPTNLFEPFPIPAAKEEI